MAAGTERQQGRWKGTQGRDVTAMLEAIQLREGRGEGTETGDGYR